MFGLRANFHKTQAIWIGVKRGCGEEYNLDENIIWNHSGKFKLLGIHYNLEKVSICDENLEIKIESMRKLLSDWSFRNLTLVGKVTVIKTLALPLLVQCLTVLPDSDPSTVDKLQKEIFQFIWNNKTDKIKRNIMINTKEKGGLSVPHVNSFSKALKLSWVKKILDANNHAPWKILLTDNLEKWGNEKIWFLKKEGLQKISYSFNDFWKCVIKAWGELQNNHTTAPNDILAQPIWLNDKIKIDRKMVWRKSWMEKGIYFVNDLLNDNGIFMSGIDLESNYSLWDVMTLNSLISAIPTEWKTAIKHSQKQLRIKNENLELLKETKKKISKIFYVKYIKSLTEVPAKARKRWEESIETEISEETLSQAFKTSHNTTRNTKLITLQYKLLHRITTTNSKLYKFKLLETELCSFCGETKETIIHLFYFCSQIRNLWIQLNDLIIAKLNVSILDTKTVFLGYCLVTDPYNKTINLLILLLKQYIYDSRCKKTIPIFRNFVEHVKYYKTVEMLSSHLVPKKQSEEIKKIWTIIENIIE